MRPRSFAAMPARSSLPMFALLGFALALGIGAAAAASLRAFDGDARTLEPYFNQGRWVVVMIWASDCPVCNREVGGYARLHGEREDIEVVGISIDGEARELDAELFTEQHQVGFDNLIGEAPDVARMYANLTGAQFRGTPSFLVYSPTGELKAAQAGGVPASVVADFITQGSQREPGG